MHVQPIHDPLNMQIDYNYICIHMSNTNCMQSIIIVHYMCTLDIPHFMQYVRKNYLYV